LTTRALFKDDFGAGRQKGRAERDSMKTSCSSWSYHRTIKAGRMDQLSWLHECARLELDGVELLRHHFPSTDEDCLRRVKKTCADLYLTVAMVSAGGHLTAADDSRRADDIRDIARWTRVAAWLGAPCVRFFAGSGAEMDAGGPALYAKVKAAIQEIAEIGREYGIVVALENHGDVSAGQLLALHRDVDSPWLKFTLDTGNFPPASRVGPQTYESIGRCAAQAAIVHAKFFNVEPDGADRDFDWVKIHGLLAKAGFRGFLSIEYEGADADEPAVVARVARFLNALR
jgi:sugar phosphate isomerase/epimerase